MKEREINSVEDLRSCFVEINNSLKSVDYKKAIVSYKFCKNSRSSSQLRAYWRCIAEMKKAFNDVGYRFDSDEIHHFVKMKSGFTKVKHLPNSEVMIIPKSISDESEDINVSNMNFLIEFMLEWTVKNLNYNIKL